jgi:hypothetical protein
MVLCFIWVELVDVVLLVVIVVVVVACTISFPWAVFGFDCWYFRFRFLLTLTTLVFIIVASK